jgi:hypothetical protein
LRIRRIPDAFVRAYRRRAAAQNIGAAAVDLIDLELLVNVLVLPTSLPCNNEAKRGIIALLDGE